MSKKSFLLVSLNENKAKKLAEVISNNTCRKILDHLSEKKDATESDISKDLNIPISTVHYNMQALVEARLVKSDEYHYSEKGKEVNHYKLANQYVIIAPEGEKSIIRERLKSLIPTALIMGAAALVIKLFSGTFGATMMKASSTAAGEATPMLKAAAAPVVQESARALAQDTAVETTNTMLAENAPAAVPQAIQYGTSNVPEIALWFFIGAVSGVAIYLLVEYIRKKIKMRRKE